MNKQLIQGIIIMMLSAILTACGQLFWKLSAGHFNLLMIVGFICYGCGAMLMIVAFSKGEISILHPIMSVGYIISIILAYIVLDEPLSIQKILGIIIIMIGIYIIARGERK